MTENCESTTVKIVKLVLRWFDKHMALAKKILTLAAWGFVAFCVGLGLGVGGYVIKNILL